jgi:hypothetical protein
MARIVLDTDVVSLYRAGRLPAELARQVVTNDIRDFVDFAELDGLVLLDG